MENQSLLWKIADVSVFFVAKSDVTGLFSWNFPIANGVYHSSGRFFSLSWQGKPRWHLHRWQVAALRSGAETGPRLTVTYRANSAVFGGIIRIYVQKSWGVAFLLQHVSLAQLGFDLEHLDVRDSGCEQQWCPSKMWNDWFFRFCPLQFEIAVLRPNLNWHTRIEGGMFTPLLCSGFMLLVHFCCCELYLFIFAGNPFPLISYIPHPHLV